MFKLPANPHGFLGLMRWGFIVIPLCIIVLGGARAWFEERDRLVENALVNAQLVRQYALRVLEAQSAVLDQVGRSLADVDLDAVDREVLRERLLDLERDFRFGVSLGITTGDGRLITSSRTYLIDDEVSEQDFYQVLRNGDESIAIDRVNLAAIGRDSIIVAKRRPGDRFAGVLLSAVDVDTFTSFFGEITQPKSASASLLRADGKLLVRHRAEAPPVVLAPDAAAMSAIASADSGTYETVAVTDGVRRIYAFKKLRQLPLFAHYGVATRSIWATWAERIVPGAILLLLAALLGYVALREAMRRMKADADAARAQYDRQLLDEAQRSAAFRETLLRELHHRVKNNLLQVQSLLRMRNTRSGVAKAILDEIENRVWAIGQVHDLLHQSEKLSSVAFEGLVRSVCGNQSIVPPERNVKLECESVPMEVDVELASPLALILVELLTNAIKHAFPDGRRGTIKVTIRPDGQFGIMEVADDGAGLPEGATGSRRSGLGLVDGLVKQVGGTLETATDAGTRFLIRFPLHREGADHPAAEADAMGTSPTAVLAKGLSSEVMPPAPGV
jgi:two-component sensor histidine kinase